MITLYKKYFKRHNNFFDFGKQLPCETHFLVQMFPTMFIMSKKGYSMATLEDSTQNIIKRFAFKNLLENLFSLEFFYSRWKVYSLEILFSSYSLEIFIVGVFFSCWEI